MLSQEQNDTLARVGPGTRMGNLMRRYWHPIAATAELDKNPIKAVKLLGESLVLYRDKQGEIGLLAEACPHRGASLAYGILEYEGLRCPYHGWLYNAEGRCLDQPMELFGSTFKDRIKTTAYPVQELGGLIFAYLGPDPIPLLPRYNVLVWGDAVREINGLVIPCNWLQVMENLLDPMHVEFLHGRYFAYVLECKGGDQLQEFLARHAPAPMKKIGFDLFEHGIIERHVIMSDEDYSWKTGSPSFFPTTTLLGSPGKSASVIFVVPMDDTHTWFILHMASRAGIPIPREASIPFWDVPGTDEAGRFITDTANGQDFMVVVSQGEVARRDAEHLGMCDTGIALYRELLMEQLDRVERGEDPMNVYRDPGKNQLIEFPMAEKVTETSNAARSPKERREVVIRS